MITEISGDLSGFLRSLSVASKHVIRQPLFYQLGCQVQSVLGFLVQRWTILLEDWQPCWQLRRIRSDQLLRLLELIDDRLRGCLYEGVITLSKHELGIDRSELGIRVHQHFVAGHRHHRGGTLGDVGNDETKMPELVAQHHDQAFGCIR